MKDARGIVLYVGKAQSLRNRVRSYWQKQSPDGEAHLIRSVIDRVADLETTLTDSVSEALLLEANLIKRFQPRFNVRLKDDKSYPYIKLTLADDFPRVQRTRKLVNDGSRYFGPYASASSVDESMNLIRRLFPFRTCTIDITEGKRALARPCLLYHIKRCQGPCIEAISKEAYGRDIAQIELFLEGHQEALVKGLKGEMEVASERTDYERAAALRDKVRAIERTMESQKMAAFARTALDLVGLARQDNQAAVQLFVVRDGAMIGRDVYLLEAPRDVSDDQVLSGFLLQFYARAATVPPEILVRNLPPDAADLEQFLAERRAGAVHLRAPRRGEKRQLLELAERNAAETLAREQVRWLADQGKTLGALTELAEALGLANPPMRIECYDISNFQGKQSVASMVVFEDGKPRTGEYRRFRIKTVQGPERFRQPPGGPPPPVPASRRCRGGQRRGAPLAPARPGDRRRRQGPGQCGRRGLCRARPGRHRRWPAWPRSARSCSCPAGPNRSSCPRHRPPCTSSNASGTRPIASRSRTTATSGRKPRSGRPSTSCPGSARSASERSCGSSDRPSGCARLQSSRSPPCPASGLPLPGGSRRPWRPRTDLFCYCPPRCAERLPS